MNSQSIRQELCRCFNQGTYLYGPLGGIAGAAIKKLGGNASFHSGYLMGGLQPIVNKGIEIFFRKKIIENSQEQCDLPTFFGIHTISWVISAGISKMIAKEMDRKSFIGIQGIILVIASLAYKIMNKDNRSSMLFPIEREASYFEENKSDELEQTIQLSYLRQEAFRCSLQGAFLYGPAAGMGGLIAKKIGWSASFDSGYMMGMLQPIVNKISEIFLRKKVFASPNKECDISTFITMHTFSWLVSAGISKFIIKQMDIRSFAGMQAAMLGTVFLAWKLFKENDHLFFPIHFEGKYFF